MPNNKKSLRTTATGLLVAATLLLSGCASNDTLANQFKSGDNKNYIAGDGTVSEYAAADRGAAVTWRGGQLLVRGLCSLPRRGQGP
jgi:hypothetical protein